MRDCFAAAIELPTSFVAVFFVVGGVADVGDDGVVRSEVGRLGKA